MADGDSRVIPLPSGCVAQDSRVMCFARSKADYDNVVKYAKANRNWVVAAGEGGSRQYVSWTDTNGIDYQVLRPTESEEARFSRDQ